MSGGENKSMLHRPRTSGHVYSLVQRVSVAEFGHFTAGVPAGAVAAQFFSSNLSFPVLGKNQAIRIVSGFVSVFDPANTGKLQLEYLACGVFVAPTQAMRRSFLAPITKAIIANNAVNFGFSDDEFILGQDYSEIGMAGGAAVSVNAHGALTNLDAGAAKSPATSMAVLAEIYDVS